MPKVASVTVAFDPDPARLAAQAAALRGEVGDIIVVDNGSAAPVSRIPALSSAHVITLPANAGLARGFNVGIAAARERGSELIR